MDCRELMVNNRCAGNKSFGKKDSSEHFEGIFTTTDMHPKQLLIDDFSYELPTERIALHPLVERDASLLLHYKNGYISTHVFRELPVLRSEEHTSELQSH